MGRPAALTPEQVHQIRIDGVLTLKQLATEFKVSLLTVWKAKNGKPPYDVVVSVDPASPYGDKTAYVTYKKHTDREIEIIKVENA